MLPLDSKIREVAVLASLLHDVGELILASEMPDEFCTVPTRSRLTLMMVSETS